MSPGEETRHDTVGIDVIVDGELLTLGVNTLRNALLTNKAAFRKYCSYIARVTPHHTDEVVRIVTALVTDDPELRGYEPRIIVIDEYASTLHTLVSEVALMDAPMPTRLDDDKTDNEFINNKMRNKRRGW